MTTNKFALVAFLGDWVRDEALQRRVQGTNDDWHEIIDHVRSAYGMEECDLGVLSRANVTELVGRLTVLFANGALHSPPPWNPKAAPSSAKGTGWPGGPILCLESVSVQGTAPTAGAEATLEVIGWNLADPQPLSFFDGTGTVDVDAHFVTDGCGRSQATVKVVLTRAGKWGVNLVGQSAKSGLLDAIEVA